MSRVAIVHDWLVTNAGAEKVLEEIVALYPNADIFSIVDFLSNKDRKEILGGKRANYSFIQTLPFSQKYFRNYLFLFPKAIESINLKKYDLIISSSWAVAKGVKKDEKQLHISYCHTPIRYAWDLYEEYIKDLKQPKKFLVEKILQYIREWDINSLDRVDYFIANSKFVKDRIKRTYKRDATVIYPPVDTNKFSLNRDKRENFYLTASRLVPYKKVKLIVETFNQMPDKNLVVIGDGEELKAIKSISKDNITILGYQPDEVLVKYMKRAKAFVYGAIEDFGIIPVEAQACGTPVIALNKGGTAETVIDGLTGVHFKEQNIKEISNAVERFEKMSFDSEKIRNFSINFSKDIFSSKIKKFIDNKSLEFFNL